ncbi:uncharacterized protein FIBRA_05267 [Fibroporia radiculosa]|uniref:F-box domain-containing protein n=1 Tax=Fibroporia radiculosa TaxID=599839 RepID=J4GQP1_9APHY|nr:uncharacterized protein FIBRA_05267 [Fibroporia radiculosa]CCM03145.1 predicted protein [Fibroporia radiculosa]
MTAYTTSSVHTPLLSLHEADSDHPISFPFALRNPNFEEAPLRARFHHTGVVNVRGMDIMSFCTTITAPGLRRIARQVWKMTIDFEDIRPTHEGLELVSTTLTSLTSCTDLTLLGLPSVEKDGWILRDTTFQLERFATNLSPTSPDVLAFLEGQSHITELNTMCPHPHVVRPEAMHQPVPFPNELIPALNTVECPAPFLVSLLCPAPDVRPLTSLRVDLSTQNAQVTESEALTALGTISENVGRLSLRRSMCRTTAMPRHVVEQNLTGAIDQLATKSPWKKLRFLEMRDGMYDLGTIPRLAGVISTCFPHIETLVWAPSGYPGGSRVVTAYIGSIFLTFCRSLRQFVCLDNTSDPENKRYMSVEKQSGGKMSQSEIDANDAENMWRTVTI